MEKLRRSFRSSFRRKDSSEEEGGGQCGGGGGARQWPADEAAVRSNSCCFEVKYLGSVEVGDLVCQIVCASICFRSLNPEECKYVRRP